MRRRRRGSTEERVSWKSRVPDSGKLPIEPMGELDILWAREKQSGLRPLLREESSRFPRPLLGSADRTRVTAGNGKPIQTCYQLGCRLDSYSVRHCGIISPDRAGSATAARRCLHPIFRLRTAAPGGWNISHTLPTVGALFWTIRCVGEHLAEPLRQSLA